MCPYRFLLPISKFSANRLHTMSSLSISPFFMERAVKEWLSEDLPTTDFGASVVGAQVASACFYVKSPLVISGFPFVEAVFKRLGCTVEWEVAEGSYVQGSGSNRIKAGHVRGPAFAILQGERTALELLTRSSASATYARRCVEAAKSANPAWKGRVAATRKTTPGLFRMVEKYGATVGGADPHRYNLSSMVMLKDNHIDVAGGIEKSVVKTRALCGFSTKIEVECRSVDDAMVACRAGADVVMLDNFSPADAAVGAKEIKTAYPHVIVEASGGMTADTLGAYTAEHVDILSVGKITHGPPTGDISLKIVGMAKL